MEAPWLQVLHQIPTTHEKPPSWKPHQYVLRPMACQTAGKWLKCIQESGQAVCGHTGCASVQDIALGQRHNLRLAVRPAGVDEGTIAVFLRVQESATHVEAQGGTAQMCRHMGESQWSVNTMVHTPMHWDQTECAHQNPLSHKHPSRLAGRMA